MRHATRADSEGIFRVLVSAFNLKEGCTSWHNMKSLSCDGAEHFLVMERQSEIIGTVMVSPHWLRVGSAKILKGDVGEVAVLRELHGRGLGTQLMQECVAYLRESGCHLSRLGGLSRFYARFGYVPFPRRYYEFLLQSTKAGASVVPPERLVELTPEQERCVRLYHPREDWHHRNALYDSFNQNRSGSLIEERGPVGPSFGDPDPSAFRFVYENGGEVSAYLFGSEYPGEHTPFEAKVTIGDLAFDMRKPEAFTTLMRYGLREALRRGAERVTVRLPFDPLLQRLLSDAALPFSLRELHGGLASNMVLLVDLAGLLKSIAPELSLRRAQAPSCSPFSVRLRVDEQEATLGVGATSVEVTDDGHAKVQLACDVATFLRWTLGLNGFDEWQQGVTHTLTREQVYVFANLFRREPCASGPWG